MGLVTGACFAEIGHQVTCLDVNKKKLDSISKGKLPFFEKGLSKLIIRNKQQSKLSFTSSYKKACEADIIFICVDTPFGRSGRPNLKNFNNARDNLLANIKKDTLVVTKSTVPIGTNSKLQQFFKNKIKGKSYEIKVCSNPEFLKEGSAINDFLHPDRIIVGSLDPQVIKKMKKAYSLINKKSHHFASMSLASAELTKYASNSFLATKVSFMNEISRIADASGANMHEVKKGMGLDPRIGEKFLNSGLGYGGSCFPKDLAAVEFYQKQLKLKGGIVQGTIKVNNEQILYFLDKIFKVYGKTLIDQHIVVWGLSFKPDTDDLRESLAIKIIKLIAPKVKFLDIYDPVCQSGDIKKELSGIKNYSILREQYSFSKNARCILICTEWDQFKNLKYQHLSGFKIFDGRNLLDRSEVESNKLEYFSIGT